MTSHRESTTAAATAGSTEQPNAGANGSSAAAQLHDEDCITVVIETCSQARRPQIAADLWAQGAGPVAAHLEQFELGRELVIPDIGGGTEVDLAERLADADPLAQFRVWSPPDGDWLGTLVRYSPSQGLWTGDCDARGDLVFTETRLRSSLEDGPISRRRLDELTGHVFITEPKPVRMPEDAAGHRIAEVRRLKPSELRDLAWFPRYGHTPTAVVLDDGTVLVVASDPEGNGPGALHVLTTVEVG